MASFVSTSNWLLPVFCGRKYKWRPMRGQRQAPEVIEDEVTDRRSTMGRCRIGLDHLLTHQKCCNERYSMGQWGVFHMRGYRYLQRGSEQRKQLQLPWVLDRRKESIKDWQNKQSCETSHEQSHPSSNHPRHSASGAIKTALYMKSSSNTNGARAKAKGNPTMPPKAKTWVAARVRWLFCELFGVNA